MAERDDGPTPLGGAYSITIYVDKLGNEVDRDKADMAYVSEYDENDKWLGESLVRFTPPPQTTAS